MIDIDPRLQAYLVHGVDRDWVDNRDQFFSAPLSILRGNIDPPYCAFPAINEPPVFGLRNQGPTGRCVGYALANLIDIQRRIQAAEGRPIPPQARISADMLYHMARFHDRYEQREDGRLSLSSEVQSGGGVRTLRSVIKGFYHHGACPDSDEVLAGAWPSLTDDKDDEPKFLTIEQAKAARDVSLGAYYRLRPVLNDYHAALNDARAVLVSANMTSSWFLPETDGRIPWSEDLLADKGAHAFVLVGYNQEGFLVLNSWGNAWGGFGGRPGIRLWTYRDWAQNVVDAWVLRLGVPAPQVFDLTVGEQGQSRFYGPVQAGSLPCHELLGHYLHLDDGCYVERSAYPSDDRITARTLDLLRERARTGRSQSGKHLHRGVVLWFPGSLEPLEQAFRLAVARKKWLEEQDLYAISVFWCNDFAQHATEVLAGVFLDCEAKAGQGAAHLAELIEERAQGLGRAFWRDIEGAARRSAEGIGADQQGPALKVVREVFRQAVDHHRQVHVVAEGAGALLDSLLERLAADFPGGIEALARLTTTAALVLPAILVRPHNRLAGRASAAPRLLPFLDQVNRNWQAVSKPQVLLKDDIPSLHGPRRAGKVSGVGRPPGRILLPNAGLERRLHVGSYNRSVLHLVARSFMGHFGSHERPEPPVLLGMAAAKRLLQGAGGSAVTEIHAPAKAPLGQGPVDQLTLSTPRYRSGTSGRYPGPCCATDLTLTSAILPKGNQLPCQKLRSRN
ncbi:C1 family peptidase [Paracoccus aerius]|uniref:C1 family peptidase n=1 Tax=Paracoccus aerius TaxID=1915382 RepID=UPI00361BDA93